MSVVEHRTPDVSSDILQLVSVVEYAAAWHTFQPQA